VRRQLLLRVNTTLAAIGLAAALVVGVTPAAAKGGKAVTYKGTVNLQNSDTGTSAALTFSITIHGHRITAYQFPASLRCADGSVSNVGVNSAQQTPSVIPFTGHHFAVTVGNASTGIGLTAEISGTVTPGRHVKGDLSVNAHEDSGATPSGPLCSSTYHWTARA
jgi:hypothetical protein